MVPGARTLRRVGYHFASRWLLSREERPAAGERANMSPGQTAAWNPFQTMTEKVLEAGESNPSEKRDGQKSTFSGRFNVWHEVAGPAQKP